MFMDLQIYESKQIESQTHINYTTIDFEMTPVTNQVTINPILSSWKKTHVKKLKRMGHELYILPKPELSSSYAPKTMISWLHG